MGGERKTAQAHPYASAKEPTMFVHSSCEGAFVRPLATPSLVPVEIKLGLVHSDF